MSEDKLNQRQINFCENYLKGMTGTKASLDAGFAKASAHTRASEMLKNDKIIRYLEKRRSEMVIETDITVEYLMKNLKEIIDGKVTYKAADRLKAIELSGRYLGMWDGTKFDDSGQERGFTTHERIFNLIKKAA